MLSLRNLNIKYLRRLMKIEKNATDDGDDRRLCSRQIIYNQYENITYLPIGNLKFNKIPQKNVLLHNIIQYNIYIDFCAVNP